MEEGERGTVQVHRPAVLQWAADRWAALQDNEMDKKQIRAEVKAKTFDPVTSTEIWDTLAKMEQFISARTVLLYSSMSTEVNTMDFIGKWAESKTIVLPVVSGNNLLLRKYEPEKMAPGYRGIMEPTSDSEEIPPSQVDLAIIPGVAFDRQGNRLGHGKGFYDRLLPELDCPRIGVAYDGQIYDHLKTDDWDQKMDFVITPSNVYICKLG